MEAPETCTIKTTPRDTSVVWKIAPMALRAHNESEIFHTPGHTSGVIKSLYIYIYTHAWWTVERRVEKTATPKSYDDHGVVQIAAAAVKRRRGHALDGCEDDVIWVSDSGGHIVRNNWLAMGQSKYLHQVSKETILNDCTNTNDSICWYKYFLN